MFLVLSFVFRGSIPLSTTKERLRKSLFIFSPSYLVVRKIMPIFAAEYYYQRQMLMKNLVLTMTLAAMMCSQQAMAQRAVKNLYSETSALKVEQVENSDQTVQVNRYLFAGYNTLCLPMSLSATQLEAAAQGIRVERLAAIRQEGSVLCLYFTECTNEGIEAGVPYLVFSPTKQYLRARNTESNGISTELKTVRMTDNQGNQVAFSSSWERRTKEGFYGIPAKQNVDVLESVLVRTTTDVSFLPTRCGFSWEEQSPSANTLEIRHATAGEITAIRSIHGDKATMATQEVYDLSGRRISTPAKGIYIKGGKKMIKN